MASKNSHSGGLQKRIAAGKADPISDREREQLRAIRELYVQRFGTQPSEHTSVTPRSGQYVAVGPRGGSTGVERTSRRAG